MAAPTLRREWACVEGNAGARSCAHADGLAPDSGTAPTPGPRHAAEHTGAGRSRAAELGACTEAGTECLRPPSYDRTIPARHVSPGRRGRGRATAGWLRRHAESRGSPSRTSASPERLYEVVAMQCRACRRSARTQAVSPSPVHGRERSLAESSVSRVASTGRALAVVSLTPGLHGPRSGTLRPCRSTNSAATSAEPPSRSLFATA